MAGATSVDSGVTHCLRLVVGVALCLCWFTVPVVHSLTAREQQEIVDAHNYHRRSVYPPASNMQRVYWSSELARTAQEHADQCINTQNIGRRTFHIAKFKTVGENVGVSLSSNISELVWYWYLEGENYSYNKRVCFPDNVFTHTCDHYLQLARAKTCEVGCGIAECPGLSLDWSYSYYYNFISSYLYHGSPPAEGGPTYLVVCHYGPGFPVDEHNGSLLYKLRPYRQGSPCSWCPEDYPECDAPMSSSQAVGSQDSSTSGLCYNRAEMCLGSDPHFAIRLSGGHLLCYNFQGVQNATFNLVSNNQLQMNAFFVPDDTNWDNTWLGSIGITAFHEDKTTTLQFTAADQLIRIGERIQVEAKAIKKLTFHNGKLTMLEVPSNHTPRYPRVQVQFIESDVNFTVGFTKNGHLDLYWHSTGVPYEDSKGIVGQFFGHGVSLDVDAQLLYVQNRPPVPVEKQDLWKFMEQSFQSDTQCWTSAYHSSQGAGIVAGSYEDYIVDGLLSVQQ